MPRACAGTLAWAVVLVGLWNPPAAADGLLSLEKVADGVYAALQPAAASQNDSNSVVLINDRDVMVVDAPADPAAVAELIAAIGELTELPIRYVINSHWHSDHTQGNQVYRQRLGDSVQIVGHETLAEDVPARAGAYVREQAEGLEELIAKAERALEDGRGLSGEPLTEAQKEPQREGIARAKAYLARLEATELLPPDVRYRKELVFRRGERTIRLIHFVGHTRGDTVVHLPREGVLLTGDLLDEMPYVGHGFPTSWLAALRSLAELEFSKVVPGHGPVFAGRGQLQLVTDYLTALVEHARVSVAEKKTLEQAQEAIELASFRERLAGDSEALRGVFDVYSKEAVARAFAEASGAEIE